MVESSLIYKLLEAQKEDDFIRAVVAVLRYEDFYLKNGVLYRDIDKDLIVVPSKMETEIIEIGHIQGHYGVTKRKNCLKNSILSHT